MNRRVDARGCGGEMSVMAVFSAGQEERGFEIYYM